MEVSYQDGDGQSFFFILVGISLEDNSGDDDWGAGKRKKVAWQLFFYLRYILSLSSARQMHPSSILSSLPYPEMG